MRPTPAPLALQEQYRVEDLEEEEAEATTPFTPLLPTDLSTLGYPRRPPTSMSPPAPASLPLPSRLALRGIGAVACRLPYILLVKLLAMTAPLHLLLVFLGASRFGLSLLAQGGSALAMSWSYAVRWGVAGAAMLGMALYLLGSLPLSECAIILALARPLQAVQTSPHATKAHASLILALLALAPLLVSTESPFSLPSAMVVVLGATATILAAALRPNPPEGREALLSGLALLVAGAILGLGSAIFYALQPEGSFPTPPPLDPPTLAALIILGLATAFSESWLPHASVRLPGRLGMMDYVLWVGAGYWILDEAIDPFRALSAATALVALALSYRS